MKFHEKICRFSRENLFWIFYLRTLARCILSSWPWPIAFLFLASRGSVFRKSVLGLKYFLCLWPRTLCTRLCSPLLAFISAVQIYTTQMKHTSVWGQEQQINDLIAFCLELLYCTSTI